MRAPVIRLAVVFLRRLAVPLVLFAAFNALSVFVYTRLEGLRWLDALFWITHPQSIEYDAVHDATKVFALLVYTGGLRVPDLDSKACPLAKKDTGGRTA